MLTKHERQVSCAHTPHKASIELCEMVLKSSQEKVKNLQHELQLAREKLFDELENTHATDIWNYLRQENALLHSNLKLTEKRKLEKTIPISTSAPPFNSPVTSHASGRRYRKIKEVT